MQAIAIMGREVMIPLGLTGLGLATIDQSGPEIHEVRSIRSLDFSQLSRLL